MHTGMTCALTTVCTECYRNNGGAPRLENQETSRACQSGKGDRDPGRDMSYTSGSLLGAILLPQGIYIRQCLDTFLIVTMDFLPASTG